MEQYFILRSSQMLLLFISASYSLSIGNSNNIVHPLPFPTGLRALIYSLTSAVKHVRYSNLTDDKRTINPGPLLEMYASSHMASQLVNGFWTYEKNITNSTDGCIYKVNIVCDERWRYRTFDGSCNNLKLPILGRAHTPFSRFLTPRYQDGVGQLQTTGLGSGTPLPNPRVLSTTYHQNSDPSMLQTEISYITMQFGQIVSHDINRNTMPLEPDGSRVLQCCHANGTLKTNPLLPGMGCHATHVPKNDPFFGWYGKTCDNFMRAQPSTDLQCQEEYRQQINKVTHYLDLSTVYGSNKAAADGLRNKTNGSLRTAPENAFDGRELLPQSPDLNTSECRSPHGSTNFCFIAGDSRANQHPMLTSMQTVLFREHNRIARKLAEINTHWDDERLYQESRRILNAKYQHIVFNEYLPVLLSRPVAELFQLLSKKFGYYTGYSDSVDPTVKNEFMTSGFRSGHSTIQKFVGSGIPLKETFFNPELIYNTRKGIDFLVKNLISNPQQSMDRFKTDQVTNHMFQTAEGNGQDLSSINIQRGRDHGTPSYNDLRELCGFPRAKSFHTGTGGLEHHNDESARLLATLYSSPDDIEGWTGVSSEIRLTGGVFGPTAACLTAAQFHLSKRGDRFYYENDLPFTRFTHGQLQSIRKASLSRFLCDNTGVTSIQRNAFQTESATNCKIGCASLPETDLSSWKE